MKFGIIGYPLGHSYSKTYFTNKFAEAGLTDFSYELFPLEREMQIHRVLRSDVFGLNITIPYKIAVLHYLNEVDPEAWRIGAVNTLVRTGLYSWKGFNTDAIGFKISLLNWLKGNSLPRQALVLGSGGASKAVCFVLEALGIHSSVVSRQNEGTLSYGELTPQILKAHQLIINTTPLGMHPGTDTCPNIPYEELTPGHWIYDLVYNPANTLFLTRSQQMGARIKNGVEMLQLQAEEAWTIWKYYGKF